MWNLSLVHKLSMFQIRGAQVELFFFIAFAVKKCLPGLGLPGFIKLTVHFMNPG